jgi:polyferredoxin
MVDSEIRRGVGVSKLKYRPFRRAVQLASLITLNILILNYTPLGLRPSRFYLPIPVLVGISSDISATPGLLDVLQVTLSNSMVPLSAIAATLIIGSILGRALCGWVCPIGFIQDLASTLRGKAVKVGRATDSSGKKMKYIILLAVMGVVGVVGLARSRGVGSSYIEAMGAMADGPFIPFSPDNILFGQIPRMIVEGKIPLSRDYIGLFMVQGVILLLLFWGGASVARFWCRYLCPLGGLMSAFARFSLIGLRRHPTKCLKCPNCERACIMGVKILGRPWRKLNDLDCIMCMECADACPQGAIKPTL